MVSEMNVSIAHTGVRVSPELVVELTAEVDGKPIRADLDSEAIHRLLGPAVGDEKAMTAALWRNREILRHAIEVYVFARGAPFDGHCTLSWQDLSAFAENRPASA